jgi:hypothetical protein
VKRHGPTSLPPASLCRAIAALAFVLVASCAGGDETPRQAEAGSVEAYAGIVSLYRAGHAAEAISELSRWRLYEIEAAVTAARGRSGWLTTGLQGEAGRAGVTAALLHADAALRSWVQDAPIEHDLHLQLALQLVSWLPDAEGAAAVAPDATGAPISKRELYVAFAAAEMSVACPRGAKAIAEAGLQHHARDPELLLLAGVAQEMLALTFVHAGRARDEAEALRGARKRLAAAHAAAPGFETRLRLGHVWARLGRTAEAQPLLESAEETAQDPRQRYLAALFLGRIHERRNRPDLAARAFRRALAQKPRGQAARIALAHVVETMAGPDGARPIVLETLAASPREDWSADPWWAYYLGPPELQREPLTRLRQRVVQP